jgi:hypothetical protein
MACSGTTLLFLLLTLSSFYQWPFWLKLYHCHISSMSEPYFKTRISHKTNATAKCEASCITETMTSLTCCRKHSEAPTAAICIHNEIGSMTISDTRRESFVRFWNFTKDCCQNEIFCWFIFLFMSLINTIYLVVFLLLECLTEHYTQATGVPLNAQEQDLVRITHQLLKNLKAEIVY